MVVTYKQVRRYPHKVKFVGSNPTLGTERFFLTNKKTFFKKNLTNLENDGKIGESDTSGSP